MNTDLLYCVTVQYDFANLNLFILRSYLPSCFIFQGLASRQNSPVAMGNACLLVTCVITTTTAETILMKWPVTVRYAVSL